MNWIVAMISDTVDPNVRKYVFRTSGALPSTPKSFDGVPGLKRAIVEHGWGAFTIEVLYNGEDEREAFKKEARTIADMETNNPEWGYNVLPELSEARAHRTAPAGTANPRSKPVIKMDTCGRVLEEYPSASAAARMVGCSPQYISAVCRKLQHTAYGFVWKYKEEM